MEILKEVRKEDDKYFQGPFWIVAETFKDILRGNFRLVGIPLLCDYDGKDLSGLTKNSQRHKSLWNNEIKPSLSSDKDFDYYPRGRVSIYKGTAFIHLNSKCNTPKIIDAVISRYQLSKLNIEIEFNDEIQGSHYDFDLE